MTPRYSATRPPRRAPASSLQEYRENGDYASVEARAFWRYMTQRVPEGMDFRGLLAADEEEELRVQSKATGAAGAFLVPQDLASQIVGAARAASPIAQLSLEIPTEGGGTFALPTTTTHGTAVWTGENVAYTDSSEVFAQASLAAFKATSWATVSEELLEDSGVPLDLYLGSELGARIGDLEDAAFSVGDGSGKPLGVVNASSPFSVTTAAVGSSVLFKPADVLSAFKALAPAYRVDASWVMAADDFASLAASADTAGGLVFPSLQGDSPSLYGCPAYIGPNMPAPAVSAKSVIFGDFRRAYAIRRVLGVGVTRLNEVLATSGQVVFRAAERVDGRPALSAAAVILAHSAT